MADGMRGTGAGGAGPTRGAVEALHAVSGMALIVFPGAGAADGAPAAEGAAAPARAALPAGRRLADLTDDELSELRAGASPLTITERLIEHDGVPWLVQQTGPAWAEPAEASTDLCGLLFTRLDGSGRRHAVEGRPPGPLPAAGQLRRILAAALSGDAGGED